MEMHLFVIFIYAVIFCIETNNAATLKSNKNIDATMEYYKRLIIGDTSKLSELNIFITNMPKGGDLHHHYSGSIYSETYLNWVARNNYCVYREDNQTLKIQKYKIETRVSNLTDSEKALCITVSEIYLDNDFYRALLKRWSTIDYSNHYHEQSPPSKQFFDTFDYFGPISNSYYNEGLMLLKNTAISENVQYIETMLKSGPSISVTDELNVKLNSLNSKSNDSEIDIALTAYFNMVVNDSNVNTIINNYVKMIDTSAAGINDGNFAIRFQSYVSRGSSPSQVFGSLFSAFSSAIRSDLIVGVNIVGPENGIVSMRDYTLHMKMFRFLKQRFPTVKLAMHAGELVLGLVPPEGLQFHIREAIEIAGASRIGHGIDIFYEHNAYELLEKMKQLNIVVEAVMSSNAFILGIENNAHPMLVYKAHGVPLVIATDDAAVSRSTLSNEYLIFSDRYRPSYLEIKALVYNSIHFAFLNESEKQKQLDNLNARFESFEAMIAKVASTLYDSSISSLSSTAEQAAWHMVLFFCLVCYLSN
ncbi:unnamed protein product [Rotaria socialis]|uniref:adenosine deaminase n=3 Tax=Rotaria socialis TaxID=392032 RepID=A0A817NV55_9BILA|nr:unnamed protein product [Rotaria socialis]CAF4551887.1 unnamed protein product [Rotaria socialis]